MIFWIWHDCCYVVIINGSTAIRRIGNIRTTASRCVTAQQDAIFFERQIFLQEIVKWINQKAE